MAATDQAREGYGALGWYSLGVLTFAHILALIDRQILALLAEPIRRDLALNDVQIGLLTGFAFTLFYATLGLPFGYLADRFKRKVIIAIGLAVWSFMTAACGLARNFTQLLLARFCVGIGEASLAPSANSLISDLFPAHKLGRAMGIYSLAQSLGTGIALVLGAYMLIIIGSMPQLHLPVIGTPRPWQLVFFMVGLPGILLALLMKTVHEPERARPVTEADQAPGAHADAGHGNRLLPYLRENVRLYFSLWVGFGLVLLTMHSLMMWTPSFQIRVLGWTPSQSGLVTGLVFATFGLSGALTGGFIADRCSKQDRPDRMIRITALAIVLAIPFAGSTTLLVHNESLSVLFLGLTIFPLWSVGTLFQTVILLSTPGHFRGRVIAISVLTGHLIGGGIGPLAVGMISEYVFRDPAVLGQSLSIVMLTGLVCGSLVLLSGLKVITRQMTSLQHQPPGGYADP